MGFLNDTGKFVEGSVNGAGFTVDLLLRTIGQTPALPKKFRATVDQMFVTGVKTIPVVTIVALDFGFLFSGALITETIFAYPGMGKLIYDAIMGNDFNLALVALLLATVLTLVGNALADVAYVGLDPRISFREAGK